jgi:aspartyl-tRNA(Asn)/glutamyl-tRNA(Gln) amidotransferase subunit A
MTALTDLSLREVAERLRRKEVSPVEVTQACLDRIQAVEDKLTAFVLLTADAAMEAAQQAEQEIAVGQWKGELHGVPVALKDLYDIKGLPTTSSSKVRANYVAPDDSACTARLQRAGAVIVGKTHTHEFAYGISTPTTRNPWNIEHMPGGSSGGSAAVVAARGCYMGMGSDTGGSIRIPASVCGTVGLKPTYGRVSRYGVTSLSWSLDHVGPLTRTVADAAVCLNALAGHDPRDPGSADEPVLDYTAALGKGVKGLRLGVPSNYYFDHVDPELEALVRAAIDRLGAEGVELRDVEIPLADQIMAVEFGLCLPEASAYHMQMLRDRPDDYQEDVRLFLEAGEMVPATRYIQALRVRQVMKAAWRRLFDQVDAVIAPAVPAPATKVGQKTVTWSDGTEEPITPLFVRLSAPANITGLPAMAVPCGFTQAGLPVGFQAIGRPFDEATVIRIGDAYQRMTDWHTRAPAL